MNDDIFSDEDLFLIDDAELMSEVSEDELQGIGLLAERHLKLNKLEDRLDELLKKVKEANRRITDELLPRKMEAANTSRFDLVTGEVIEVKHIVQANMPKSDTDEYPKAITWLESNELGDIIKKDVIAKFGRGDGELAERVMAAVMRESNGSVPVEMKESVHYATLNSVLKKRMEKGLPMPTTEDDGFSIYIGPRAKIARAKKR